MIRKQLPAFTLGLIITSVVFPNPSLAHSTIIEYQATEAIAIEAKFDNGQPMVNAQVVVYAPDKPSVAWQKGLTDEQGKFSFIPDYNNEGNWSVKVRSAGHGNVINIPIQSQLSSSSANQLKTDSLPEEKKLASEEENKTNTYSSSIQTDNKAPLSLPQKLLMAMMGSWGFVGTALFFSRKNKTLN